MWELLRIKILQLFEVWRQKDFREAWRCSIYISNEVVPVEKDLGTLKPVSATFAEDGLELVEITKENFEPGRYRYALKSRGMKVAMNLRKGYRAYALVDGREVVGDIWFVTPQDVTGPEIHPDVSLFDLHLGAEDVYGFDMYVTPDRRGKAIANAFLASVLSAFKDQGRRRAFGYFEADNVPALWVHRLLGYRELPRFLVKRSLFFKVVKPKPG